VLRNSWWIFIKLRRRIRRLHGTLKRYILE
jgi:hypothetical protein